MDQGISLSLVIRKSKKEEQATDNKQALAITIRSFAEAYRQILLYIPRSQKDMIVVKNTMLLVIKVSLGKNSNLSQ